MNEINQSAEVTIRVQNYGAYDNWVDIGGLVFAENEVDKAFYELGRLERQYWHCRGRVVRSVATVLGTTGIVPPTDPPPPVFEKLKILAEDTFEIAARKVYESHGWNPKKIDQCLADFIEIITYWGYTLDDKFLSLHTVADLFVRVVGDVGRKAIERWKSI